MSLYEFAKAKGSLIILCYLDRNGKATRYELSRNLKISKEAIAHAIEVLERLDLCETESHGDFPFSKPVGLTHRGRKLMVSPVRDLPALLLRSSGLHISLLER